jgi:hemolysin III
MSTAPPPPTLVDELKHRADEWANSLTHGVGFLLAAAGSVALMAEAVATGGRQRVLGCGIYCASLIAVYAASTLSHWFLDPHWRSLFRRLDQAFIYLLIAGTYTPIALTFLNGGWLWALFAAIWLVALLGFISKLVFRHRIEAVSLSIYGVLGWMPALAIQPAYVRMPGPAFWLMVIGGVLYTVGMLFLFLDHKARYFHATWHLLVMAASTCHYATIFWYMAR